VRSSLHLLPNFLSTLMELKVWPGALPPMGARQHTGWHSLNFPTEVTQLSRVTAIDAKVGAIHAAVHVEMKRLLTYFLEGLTQQLHLSARRICAPLPEGEDDFGLFLTGCLPSDREHTFFLVAPTLEGLFVPISNTSSVQSDTHPWAYATFEREGCLVSVWVVPQWKGRKRIVTGPSRPGPQCTSMEWWAGSQMLWGLEDTEGRTSCRAYRLKLADPSRYTLYDFQDID